MTTEYNNDFTCLKLSYTIFLYDICYTANDRDDDYNGSLDITLKQHFSGTES